MKGVLLEQPDRHEKTKMRLVCLLTVALLLFATNGGLSAQGNISDLANEIASGRVVLNSATGNGSSSGSAVDGFLVNQADAEIRIDVYLSRPIYLVNSGRGQNMVAAQVYLGGGRYQSVGRRSFITLRPRVRTNVRFTAYCADFDRENPARSDGFSIGVMPENLTRVMANIRSYSVANPDVDITVPAQVAIWLAQGESAQEIRSKFPLTPADDRLANALIR